MIGHQVGDFVRLEVAPHILDWIEFGGVGRQAFHKNAPTRGGDVSFDQETAVDGRSVPENQNVSRYMSLEMSEKINDLRALDAAVVNLKIEAPQGQAADDRKAFPVEGFLKDGRWPARSPGAHARGPCAQAAFIDEDDRPALLARLFFKAGQVLRCHCLMAFSSRSMALRSGRWQLKPLAPSRRQT